ncbi:hypothetical protein [Trinickia diaoshuihuensis]|uniref:hypothetical protein n=1 Tax=Trinickia diaoshuihuensis TaxID=2292265 RepID=UPI000E2518FD|nr:hypothetical protein [Trinickia diaoshuihuensis]
MSKFHLTSRLPADEKQPVAQNTAMDFVTATTLEQSQSQRPPKPIRLNLDIDHVRHRKLKMYAVENGLSVSEVIRALIDTVIHA